MLKLRYNIKSLDSKIKIKIKMKRKITLKTKFILVFVLFFSLSLLFILVNADNSVAEVKEGRIVIDEPSSSGSFFISSSKISQNEVISPVLRTDFDFNEMYAQWNQENAKIGQDFQIYVRFLNENWSDWLEMPFDDDYQGKDDGLHKLSTQLAATKLTDSFQYKIIYDPHADKKADLTNLEFIYLNSLKGPKSSFKISTNSDSLNIISREQWGANETYKYDEEGNDLWEEEYYLPKKFVIHHTAGDANTQDPMATIRAIQYFHAVGRGWGDIGYNYLIDTKGNIYEGREGGDGVVGGHAYMRNQNTIGIAIIGCYDPSCKSPDELSAAARNSLNKLIAVKSREFNIDPLGESAFHGELLPNVIGHRDVGSTTCPGDKIYEELPDDRALAYNILQDLGGYKSPLPTSAEFVRQSDKEVDIEETKNKEITVEFKNTGQAVWRGYEDAGLFIADSSIKNKMAKIGSVNIALNKDKASLPIEKYQLLGGNVYPGDIGKFKITLDAPENQKQVSKTYTLAWQDKGYFPESDFSITVNKIPCTTCEINQAQNNSVSPVNSAMLVQSDFPEEMPAGSTHDITIQFKNTGNQQLLKDDLKLHIIYEKTHISPFRNNSWYTEYAMIPPDEAYVSPGNTATFHFKLKAPDVIAPFPHTITLLDGGQQLYKWDKTINVISSYASELTENTLPVAVKNTWRPTIKLTFKNTGTKTWKNPILKSYDIDYTNSWFRDWSWLDNKTIKKSWKNVEPGKSITFEFRITPYWKPNTYPHVYKLIDGDEEILIDGKSEFLTYTRVDK